MTDKPEPGRPAKRPKIQSNGISSVPDDVLAWMIFIRLPVSSVLAVGLVCRSWYTLTKSPCFILSHARRARKNIVFMSKEEYTLYHVSAKRTAELTTVVESGALDLPSRLEGYVGRNSRLRLLASCDGLLCFDFEGKRNRRFGYVVCNPVTRDWLNVPRNLSNWGNDVIIGFYFHSSTGEYRLLQQYYSSERVTGYRYEVFSIGRSNRVWRRINASSGISSGLHRSHIYVHGSIHFLSSPVCIVAFDTNTEKFRRMSISGLHRQGYLNDLIEVGGNLGLCQTNAHPYSKEMDIWCLKDYSKEEWVKQYTVSVQDIRRCTPLAIWEDRQELLLKFSHGCFLLCNLESKTFEKEEISNLTYLWNWVPHIESLVSCNSLKNMKYLC